MPGGIYAFHRENQREWILKTAQELFIQSGIISVTIADIAKAAHLTRATVYQYFDNKEQVAWEIFKTVIQDYHELNQREGVWAGPGSGYQKVEKFVLTFMNHILQNPSQARFTAEFNYLYGKRLTTEQVSQTVQEYLGEDRQMILDSIHQGLADGSLRPDLDPELTMVAIVNFINGMLARLGELGPKVEGEFGMSSERIFHEICRIFLSGLRPQSSS